jgi:Na+/H+ antiporter NhaC
VFLAVSALAALRPGEASSPAGTEHASISGFFFPHGASGSLPLLAGSIAGLVVAVALAFAAGLRGEIAQALGTVLRSSAIAIALLYLAWTLGVACDKLGTASYLRTLLGDHLHASYLPPVLFLLACAISAATGSFLSTLAVLLPLVVGLAYDLGTRSPLGGHAVLLMSVAAVLEGAVFGNHCSPISHTSVLSSAFSASDHVDHIATQAPYSILTMLVALVAGYLPCGVLGWSPWICLPLSAVLLFVLVRGLGKQTDLPPTASPTATAPTAPTA